MFTFEIYPTIVRTTGMGLCSMVARIGAIAAPEVKVSIFINFTISSIVQFYFTLLASSELMLFIFLQGRYIFA